MNLQSTKIQPTVNNNNTETTVDNDDFHPSGETEKTFEYASMVIPFNAKTTTYTDLTGRFPYKSSTGNEHYSPALILSQIFFRQPTTQYRSFQTTNYIE